MTAAGKGLTDVPMGLQMHHLAHRYKGCLLLVAAAQQCLHNEAPASSASVQAVLTGPAVNGLTIVYPSKAGKEVWTSWKAQ